MKLIGRTKDIYKKITNNRTIIFLIGTFVGIIITILFTPTISTFFAQFYPELDREKPELISYSPNINERILVSPQTIKIGFMDEGGSGIDKENSDITLRGTKSGIIGNVTKEYNGDMILITFSSNQSMEPDSYTIDIELRDKAGNIVFNSYSFYILENPELVVTVKELIGQFKILWSERLNMSADRYNYYLLHISNQNNVFLDNVNFDVQFPGVIIDYKVQEDIGNYGYNVQIGQGNIFVGTDIEDITSCYSRINIKEIAPEGDLIVVYYVDLKIDKYGNAFWCRPGIFDSSYILTSNFENEFKISYDYQEYGFWYHKESNGVIEVWG
jgi:hypothetical protein